jgi:hypothetical protein
VEVNRLEAELLLVYILDVLSQTVFTILYNKRKNEKVMKEID